MTEIEQLREEIAKLRERVAVLEARPTPPAMPLYIGAPNPWPKPAPLEPWQPPLTVTC